MWYDLGPGRKDPSRKLIEAVYQRDGEVCQYCGATDAPRYIVEHIISRAVGGVSELYNLVVACDSCNRLKGRAVWLPLNIEQITMGNPRWYAIVTDFADNVSRVVNPHSRVGRRAIAFNRRRARGAPPLEEPRGDERP